MSGAGRQQAEKDEALKAKLASLTASSANAEWTQLANELVASCEFWKAKALNERKRAEASSQQAAAAVHKLMSVVASEGESLLTSLKTGGHISAAHTATSSPSSTATSSPPSMHATQLAQSHLSRRVSFNRDVVMVLSDTIGQGSDSSSVVPPVEEGDEEASTDGRPKKVFTGAPSLAEKESSAHRREESRERRLSRTEFNEGLILKQHLDLSDLEKDEIRNTATAVQ